MTRPDTSERDSLFVNASQVVTCAGPPRARRGAEMSDAGVAPTSRVAVDGERIAAVGPLADAARRDFPARDEVDCRGGVLTPGLVDSHTHGDLRPAALRGAGDARRRARLHGDRAPRRRHPLVGARPSHAQRGRAVRARASRGLRRLASYGMTTVEVKSGYGLSLDDELKTLRVIARLADALPHAHRPDVPRRARDSARASRVARRSRERTSTCSIHEMIPAVARGEARALRRRVLRDRRLHRRREPRDSRPPRATPDCCIKLHADELTSVAAARSWPRRLGATSADHLAAVSRRRHRRARAGGDRRHAASRDDAVPRQDEAGAGARASSRPACPSRWRPISIPGRRRRRTCRSILTLGVSQLRLSVAEAVIAATVNGAAALALADRRRTDRAGLLGRSGAVRRSGTFASCRTGTATVVASRRGCEANLVTRVT